MIDGTCERARYIVFDGGRLVPDWRLIPLPARIDVVHQALHVDVEDADTSHWLKFIPSRFRQFNRTTRAPRLYRPAERAVSHQKKRIGRDNLRLGSSV